MPAALEQRLRQLQLPTQDGDFRVAILGLEQQGFGDFILLLQQRLVVDFTRPRCRRVESEIEFLDDTAGRISFESLLASGTEGRSTFGLAFFGPIDDAVVMKSVSAGASRDVG